MVECVGTVCLDKIIYDCFLDFYNWSRDKINCRYFSSLLNYIVKGKNGVEVLSNGVDIFIWYHHTLK